MIKVAPSLLAADFANLKAEVDDVRRAGADYLHVDVMDGVFVPNISFGLPILETLRRTTLMTLDVHLMITNPLRFAREFCRAGADILVFHIESEQPQNLVETIKIIRGEGKKAGLAVKPQTSALTLIPYIELLDLVLVMTVEPGFSGQKFIPSQLPKIGAVRSMIDQLRPECELEVDGGITPATSARAIRAGADVLVAGNAVFGAADRSSAIAAIRGQCYERTPVPRQSL